MVTSKGYNIRSGLRLLAVVVYFAGAGLPGHLAAADKKEKKGDIFTNVKKQRKYHVPRPAPESGRDWREECRAKLSGTYINFYNIVEVGDSQNIWLTREINKTKKALTGLRISLKELRKEDVRRAFDLDLEEKIREKTEMKDLLENNLAENRRLLEKNRQDMERADHRRRALKKQMEKVFRITPMTQRIGKYVDVRYLHQCGRWEYLCPLPPAQARALLAITPPGGLALACERYANTLVPTRQP